MNSDASSPPDASEQSGRPSTDANTARQVLLEEARTAANRQIGQINKVDDAAVRTLRMALLFAGILAGGSQFFPFPAMGVLGALGTWALVASLLGGIYV